MFSTPPFSAPGKFSNHVPLLLGSNENEGVLFNLLPLDVSAADMAAGFLARFGSAAAAVVPPLYPVRACADPFVRGC